MWSKRSSSVLTHVSACARWKLGKLLAAVERAQGARSDLTSDAARPKFTFIGFLRSLKPSLALQSA